MGSWDRSHRLPDGMCLVGMRQMGSWQVASPLATTGAHALRMARYAVPYLLTSMFLHALRFGGFCMSVWAANVAA